MNKTSKLYSLVIVISLFLSFSCKSEKKIDKSAGSELKVDSKKVDTGSMAYFKGGKISIGSISGMPNEGPTFEMEIAPFYIDKNLVSVAEFRVFINKTGYKTEAEKFGDSGVFSFETGTWSLIQDVTWEYPMGETKSKVEDSHPVTHVSWNDAKAYASWAGKRLPTEFEWEFAAKNGKNDTPAYSWGENLVVDSQYMANVWQGETTKVDSVFDGYLLTSPVGIFGELESGLTDMGGNVWQWCENMYESYPGSTMKEPSNPKVRSTRGGSFMFDQAGDKSFTTTFRGKNSIDTSLFNTGFRCAK